MDIDVVHFYDIPLTDPGELFSGGIDERTTYFWAHAAYSSSRELRQELPSVFGSAAPRDSSWRHLRMGNQEREGPHVLAYARGSARVLSVKGTNRNTDVTAVLDFAYAKGLLMRRVEAAYLASFKRVPQADMLLEIALEYLDRLPKNARVHPGIYLRAFQTLNLMWQHLVESRAPPDATITIHGHSLGAACATLAYAWLRDIYVKGGRDVFGTIDLKCSCIACPMFCDGDAWRAWFGDTPVGQVEHYRHYYTQGDVFVHEVPALAGYTHAYAGQQHGRPDMHKHTHTLACEGHGPAFGKVLLAHSSLYSEARRSVFVKYTRNACTPMRTNIAVQQTTSNRIPSKAASKAASQAASQAVGKTPSKAAGKTLYAHHISSWSARRLARGTVTRSWGLR